MGKQTAQAKEVYFSGLGPMCCVFCEVLFQHRLVHSKALSWEIIACLIALLGDFVRIQTSVMIQRPFMGNLLRFDNYVIFLSLVNFFPVYFVVDDLRFCIPIVFYPFVT